MKYLFIFGLLWVACATTKPVVNPPPPIPPVQKDTIIYKHDTLTKHDTVSVAIPFLYPVPQYVDTVGSVIITPSGGDDQPQIQAVINQHKHVIIKGQCHTKSTILGINPVSGGYGQSWLWISGIAFAQNTPGNYISSIIADFTDGPVIAIQNGKGCVIDNLQIQGWYFPPNTQLAVNTYSRSQWRTTTRDVAISPYSGICIDPFSDPASFGNDTTLMYPRLKKYYVPGMNRSGSTAIQIYGCNISGFNVDVLITAANQQNGECINISACYFGNAMSAIAATQAQAKTNWITHCMIWGTVHTILDGVHYGLAHSDGSAPWCVEGLNIAGANYQYIASYSNFQSTHRNVYAENIFRIGSTSAQTSSGAAVLFDGSQFDFEPGGNSPFSWLDGASIAMKNCQVRYYNAGDQPQQRIVLNGHNLTITGGMFGAPPVRAFGQNQVENGSISGVSINYPHAGQTFTDSIAGGEQVLLHVQGTDGWFVTKDTSGMSWGTLLITQRLDDIDSLSLYHPLTPEWDFEYPVGYVSSISGDTVRIENVGVNLRDSSEITVWKCLYKK